MDLEKNILNFYEMSIRLEYFKLRTKHLKQELEDSSRVPVDDITALQNRVDAYIEIEKTVEKIAVMPSQLLAIQNRVVKILKEILFPERQKIHIQRQHEPALAFWYDGSELFVEELK